MIGAVIDIGTLKVKCLVARVDKSGSIKPVYKSNTLTCFGVGIDENQGRVQEKFLAETIRELKRVKLLLKKYQASRYRVVSTHAMRRAKNQTYILKRIKDEVEFEVVNLSQEDEARLFYSAVMRGFNRSDNRYAVVDMGGGSVQVLIGRPDKLEFSHLMQTGAQLLHDNFTNDPINELSFTTEADLERMRNYIVEQLLPVERNLQVPIIYGSSNIIDLMQAIKLFLEPYDESRTHPYKVYTRQLQDFIKKILPLKYREREKMFTFQKGYMWGIDKAFLNMVTIAEHLQSPYIIPSNANIAEGIIGVLAGR